MKKAELEKRKGKKIGAGGFGATDRFGKGSNEPKGKEDQRTKLSGTTAGLLKNWLK